LDAVGVSGRDTPTSLKKSGNEQNSAFSADVALTCTNARLCR
jgi:hypothetical protein